jgi:hypothetical protein
LLGERKNDFFVVFEAWSFRLKHCRKLVHALIIFIQLLFSSPSNCKNFEEFFALYYFRHNCPSAFINSTKILFRAQNQISILKSWTNARSSFKITSTMISDFHIHRNRKKIKMRQS